MKKLNSNSHLIVARSTDLQSMGGLPTEIQVAPFGRWKGYVTGGGEVIEFEVTPELAAKAIEYHLDLKKRFPSRDLVIDYEHQTQSNDQAPAAGWMHSDIFLKDDGIYARVKEWTPKAAEYIRNKEYRYISPVLLYNSVEKETGKTIPLRLVNVALTNEPFIDGIKPVSAKDNNSATIIILTDSITHQPEGGTMLEQILQFLGLAAGATFDQVKEAIEKIKNGAAAVEAKYKAALKELGLPETATGDDVKAFALKHNTILAELGVKATDTLETIKGVIVAAKASSSQQVDLRSYVKVADFEAVQLQLKTRDAAEMIAKHVARGAVAAFEVEDLVADVKRGVFELKDLDTRLAKRADYSMVPLKEISTKRAPAAGDEPDELLKEIAAKANVPLEDLKKHGK